MKLRNNERIGLQLAAALYIENGGISYEEIRAIPFFTDETNVKALHRTLRKHFQKLENELYGSPIYRP